MQIHPSPRHAGLITLKGAELTLNFDIPLDAERQGVAVELQDMLVDFVDLTLIGKHLYWNVEGRLFRSVHQERDDLVDAWRILSDDIAERAVTIGASPDGQVEVIAGATRLDPVPPGHLSDRQVLRAIGDRIAEVTRRTRQRIDRVAVADPVTCDLLVGTAVTLEKQLWMVRVQLRAPGRAAEATFATPADDLNGADQP
ncbi:MAG: Dps family protein [Solirubrobacteraceae bacterium]